MKLRLDSEIFLEHYSIYVPSNIRHRITPNSPFLEMGSTCTVATLLASVMYSLVFKVYYEEVPPEKIAGYSDAPLYNSFKYNGKLYEEKVCQESFLGEAVDLFNLQSNLFQYLVNHLDDIELDYFKTFLLGCFVDYRKTVSFYSGLTIKDISSKYDRFNSYLPRWEYFVRIMNPPEMPLKGLFFLSPLIDKGFFNLNNLSIQKLIDDGNSYIDIYKDANEDNSIYYVLSKNEDGLEIYKNHLEPLKVELLDILQEEDLNIPVNSNEYEELVFSSATALANYFYIKYYYEEVLDRENFLAELNSFSNSLLEKLFNVNVDIYMALWAKWMSVLMDVVTLINEKYNEEFIIETNHDLRDFACVVDKKQQMVIVNKEIIMNLSIMQDKRFYSSSSRVDTLLLKETHNHLDDEYVQLYAQVNYMIDYKNKYQKLKSLADAARKEGDLNKLSNLEEELFYCIQHKSGFMNVREKCLTNLVSLLKSPEINVEIKVDESIMQMVNSQHSICFAAFKITAPINKELLRDFVWQSFNNNFGKISHYTQSKKIEKKTKILEQIMLGDNIIDNISQTNLVKF